MSNLTKAVLKGSPSKAKLFSRNPNNRPHYHLLVKAEEQQFDVAINIASEAKTEDVRVLYAIKQNITLPQADALLNLPIGMFDLPAQEIVGIDFIRDRLVTKEEMKLLPLFERSAPIESQGEPALKQLVDEVVQAPDTVIYAFGHRYDKTGSRNACWGFQPDDGIHNIHMNQGNYTGNHNDENGRGEDGALFIYFPDTKTWTGIYIAFQTQSFDNDDAGYPRDDSRRGANATHNSGQQRHRHGHQHGQKGN